MAGNFNNPMVQTMANALLQNMNGSNNAQAKRNIVTVNGIVEARSFALNPGESVVLVDSNEDIFYIKECDDIGKCSVKAFSYEEIELVDGPSGGVSKKEFECLSNDVAELKNMVKSMMGSEAKDGK